MLTWEENIDAQVLRKRNWTISAIARHLGRDRKTIRTYLAGDRTPGQCTPAGPDGLAVFTDYVAARLLTRAIFSVSGVLVGVLPGQQGVGLRR
jgi:transposase